MSFLTQRLIWTKTKPALIPDEKSHGLGIQREPFIQKGKKLFRTILGKEHRHSKALLDENCCLYWQHVPVALN